MTNDTLQTTPQSPEVVKGELMLTLSKEGLIYQQLLQDCENIVFTKDNLNIKRSALTNLQKVKTRLKAIKNPFTEQWKNWNEAMKSLLSPVEDVCFRKEQEFGIISREIELENQRIDAEKQRKAGILSEIDTFFINQSQAIAAATEPAELVRIEKLIGSHKANSSRYQEFLPLLNEKAANLTELIKVQKEAIKILTSLKGKEMAAEASGDDETVLALREQQEQIAQTLEQGKIDVQEKAIGMATKAEVIEPEIVVAEAPKPSRRLWKWEMVDEKAATKAGLTLVIPNKELIDAKLKEKREAETEVTENGIRYFVERRF